MLWVAEIAAASTDRVTLSSLSGDTVSQAPSSLLADARAKLGDAELTLDEYTLARVVASEHASGSPVELAAIADADYHRAAKAGRSIFLHATGGSQKYGRQGSIGRPVSTSRDPGRRHLAAARAVLRDPKPWAPGMSARGVARGATRYFDPRTQHALWMKGDPKYRSAESILESWTYNKPVVRRTTDAQGRTLAELGAPRAGGEEWIGYVAGIDAYELMLFRPATAAQDQRYAEAREVIRTRGTWRPKSSPTALLALALVVTALGVV